MKRNSFFVLFFLLLVRLAFGQGATVDSVVLKIGNLPDSSIAKALNDSSLNYRFVDFDLSYAYAQRALVYATRSNNQREMGNAYNFSGIAQQLLGKFPTAMENYSKAEEIFRKSGYKKGLASTYINIGVLNQDMGNIKSSIEYNRKAYEISLEIGDGRNTSSALNNLATLYSALNNLDSALDYNFKSLAIRKKLNLTDMIPSSMSNIGIIYDKLKQYDKSLDFHQQALEMDSANDNKKSMCIDLNNISSVLIHMGKNVEAKNVLLRANELSEEIKYKETQLDILVNLMSACENLGEMQEAVNYSKKYVAVKDSITDEDIRNSFAEMQAKLDNTVQKHEIENLQKDKLLDAERAKKKDVIIYFGTGALILFVVLLIIIFRGYNQKKKINIVITEQKNEVEHQKNMVELKNREILDSINYAQRIQQAILLPESEIQKEFSDAFILFQPKDIVSGDFYWFAESEENKIIALADCTGHGVPGGFMSMLGFEILQDVILQEEIQTTSEALKFLDKKVTDTLNKNSKSYRDGMDMALCAFNKTTGKLSFSGANRPLIHISNGILTIYKPDKHTIGGAIDEMEKVFTKVEIDLQKGDLIYLFTDGYADQFGGESGKKFKAKQLHDKLISICTQPLLEQKNILEKLFNDWKGKLEQVDDVTIIGIRI